MEPSETTTVTRLPRNIRQAEIIPQEDLNRVAAVIIGCGAIGSWLARFLAHMGVPFFLLVDPDVVTYENLALQGYGLRDVALGKVEALTRVIEGVHPLAQVCGCPEKFRGAMLTAVPRMYDKVAVFSCVDDIEVREFLFRAVRKKCGLFVDGRMASLVWRGITVDQWPDYYYEETLFRSEEANVLRCTAKGTVFTAAWPALFMGTQLMLWLKGARVEDGNLARDAEGNLLATTFEVRRPDGIPG